MPLVDIVDEHFVAAEPATVRAATCAEATWREWFPDLRLECLDDRGPLGKRWTVDGALVGTAEVWIEPWHEGVILHVFIQADPVGRVRRAARLRRGYARSLKRRMFAVKDGCE